MLQEMITVPQWSRRNMSFHKWEPSDTPKKKEKKKKQAQKPAIA